MQSYKKAAIGFLKSLANHFFDKINQFDCS